MDLLIIEDFTMLYSVFADFKRFRPKVLKYSQLCALFVVCHSYTVKIPYHEYSFIMN